MKAIIVEDTYEYYLAISDILVSIGFNEPKRFGNMGEYLKYQCKEKIDLTLIDYELIKNLQSYEVPRVFQTCKTKTIIMIAANDVDAVGELYVHGMTDYFIKNNPASKIKNRILEVLDVTI